VSILQALDVALPVVGNRFIRQELGSLSARLKDGTSLATGLKGLSVTTPFVLHTVAVGEESGKVAEALTGIANYYERELERVLSILASLLEPMMVLMMGGIVGFIVMAVLLPIFEMNVVAH
jgi:type II secretory pathway component PulF